MVLITLSDDIIVLLKKLNLFVKNNYVQYLLLLTFKYWMDGGE